MSTFDQHKSRIVKLLAKGGKDSDSSANTLGDGIQDLRDRSPKGSLDAPIVDLVHLLNSAKDYVTTSSCSGRIALFAQDEHRWLYVVHSQCDFNDVADTLRAYYTQRHVVGGGSKANNKLVVLMKTEPFILHVMCRNVSSAQALLQTARLAGFRESGISVGKNKIICAVRTTGNSMEVPLTESLICSGTESTGNQYLKFLVDYSNSLFNKNAERISVFQDKIRAEYIMKNSRESPERNNVFMKVPGMTVGADRLKRWNHAVASDPDNGMVVIFGGYGPDANGRVCRLNDVLVGLQHSPSGAGKALDWICPEIMSGARAPAPRVRHTLTFLNSVVDLPKRALVSTFLVYGGRSSPQHGMSDVWLLCVVVTQENGRSNESKQKQFENVYTLSSAFKLGLVPPYKVEISWVPLSDSLIVQPTTIQNNHSTHHPRVPEGRWSHSATLVPSDKNRRSFVWIYGGRNADLVLSDTFCFVIHTPRSLSDVRKIDEWRSSTQERDYLLTSFEAVHPTLPLSRYSHSASYIGKDEDSGKLMIAIVGGCSTLGGDEHVFGLPEKESGVIAMILSVEPPPNELDHSEMYGKSWWRSVSFVQNSTREGYEGCLQRYSHATITVASGKLLVLGGICLPSQHRNPGLPHSQFSHISKKGGILADTALLLDFNTKSISFIPVTSIPDATLLCRHKLVSTYIGGAGQNRSTMIDTASHYGYFSHDILIWCIGGGSEVLSFGGCFSQPSVLKCQISFAGPFVEVTDEQKTRGFLGGAAASGLKLSAVIKTMQASQIQTGKTSEELQNGKFTDTNIPILAVLSSFVKVAKTVLEENKLLHKGLRIAKIPSRGPKWRAIPLLLNDDLKHAVIDVQNYIKPILQNSKSFSNVPASAFYVDVIPMKYSSQAAGKTGKTTFKLSKATIARKKTGQSAKQKLVGTILLELKNRLLNIQSSILEKEIWQTIPKKFERLGGVLILPPSTFRVLETKYRCPREIMEKIWRELANTCGVDRVVRHAEISKGRMRKSQSELVFDRNGEGSWICVKENGVKYGFDCEKVMYCTSNGTEKRRVGELLRRSTRYAQRKNRTKEPRRSCQETHSDINVTTLKANRQKNREKIHRADDYQLNNDGAKSSPTFSGILLSDEVVVDLYAGIGYFTLPYLVIGGAKHVHACEINPDSVLALRKNLIANHIDSDRCTVWPGDNELTVAENLLGVADRVNMGLIPSCEDALHVGLAALRLDRGGWLHVHGNAPRKERSAWSEHIVSAIHSLIVEKILLSGWKVICTHIEKVKAYAPRVDHLVCDIWIGPAHATPYEVKVFQTKKKISLFRLLHLKERERARKEKARFGRHENSNTTEKHDGDSQDSLTRSLPKTPVHILPCYFQGEEELIAIQNVFSKSMRVTPRHVSVDKYIKSQLQGHLKDTNAARNAFVNASKHDPGFWVAESNGKIIGCVGMTQNAVPHHDKDVKAEIKHLCVASAYRGRGIGRSLLKVAINQAQSEENIVSVVAETLGHTSMAAARRLYLRCGFEEKSRREMGKGEKQFELVTFELHLDHNFSNAMNNSDESPLSTDSAKRNKADSLLSSTRSPNTQRLATVSASVPTWDTGSQIVLTHLASGLSVNALVECVKHAVPSNPESRTQIKLAPVELPYHRLAVSQRERVSWSTKGGRAATFSLFVRGNGPADKGGIVLSLQPYSSSKRNNRLGKSGCFVGIDVREDDVNKVKTNASHSFSTSSSILQSRPDLMEFVAHMVPDADFTDLDSSKFLAVPYRKVQNHAVTSLETKLVASSLNSRDRYTMKEQMKTFIRDGYAVFKSAVGLSPLVAAQAFINKKLGIPGALVQGGVQEGTGKLDGASAASPELLDLLLHPESDALRIVESFIGSGKLRRPDACQVALRFPESKNKKIVDDMNGRQWHVDGMRQGKRNPFSLLLGVALSECPSSFTGNFTVFPGSHRAIHSLILEKGRLRGVDEFRLWSVATDPSNPWCSPDKGVAAQTLKEAAARKQNGAQISASQDTSGDSHISAQGRNGGPLLLPDLGKPKQLLIRPGDIVIAHPKLAHRGAPNYSPNIRYMCYFRLRHISQQTKEMQEALIKDMWADLEGITRSIIQEASLAHQSLPLLAPENPVSGASVYCNGILSQQQIDFFREYGYLVVPDVLSQAEVREALDGMQQSLLDAAGVDASSMERLQETRLGLDSLSSTHGAGGVLDLFYERWKIRLTLENRKYSSICKELYASTYATYDGDGKGDGLWAHPYGKFDPMKDGIWAHVDRIGFRVPDSIAETTTRKFHGKSKRLKTTLLQRSLTPHLDCCPAAMHEGGNKLFPRWRPIQCFLSLSDTMERNHGGFECVPGFHHEFEEYYKRFNKSQNRQEFDSDSNIGSTLPCVGDYVHIRPKEDSDVIDRFTHVPVPSGAAVFWDQRLPHANSRRNKGSKSRCVVYGGFLPRGKGIELNEAYAKEQLRRLKEGRPQTDFWMNGKEDLQNLDNGRDLFESLSDEALEMLQ